MGNKIKLDLDTILKGSDDLKNKEESKEKDTDKSFDCLVLDKEVKQVEKEKSQKTEIFENYKSDFLELDDNDENINDDDILANEDENDTKISINNSYIKYIFIFGIFFILIFIFNYLYNNFAGKIEDIGIIKNLENNKQKEVEIDKLLGKTENINREVGGYDYQIEKIIDKNGEISYNFENKSYKNLQDLEYHLIELSEIKKVEKKKDIIRKRKEKIIEKFKQ